ncbi:hypothetical protein BLNAU_19039 [Blattamonas nauphoetae]|uniref:Uncharacterized protein n=1 Tax=Blattamonas nauphoetae TaxID=2049346 RepID=A0ABQ9X2N1_9EUKA|nr:hypothetical protein BLNAU_19039 [Blattamonas nauphoetae]
MRGTGTSTMPIHLTNLTFTADPAYPDKTVDVLVDGFNLSETISNSTIPIFDKTMANRAWGSDSVSGANTSLLAYLVPIEVEVAVQTTPGYDVGKCGHYELFCKSFQQSLVRVVNNVARIVFYSSVELGFDAIVPKPLTITSRTQPGEVSVLSSGRIVQYHAGTTTLDTIHFSLSATSTRTELFLVMSGKLNVKSCSLSSVSGTIPFGVLNVTGGSVELLSLTLSAQTISTLPFSFDGTNQTSLTSLSLTDTNTPSNELMKIVGAAQSSPITIKNSEFSKTTAAQQQILWTQNQFAPICSWSTGALSFTTCTATLTSTRLAGLTNGGIVVIGATVTLSQCTFQQNGKTQTDADFPSLQRNIVCSGGGSVTVSSVAGGDGVDPDSHFWISEGDCTVTLPNPQSNTPFVTPTLSDAVYSANDTHLTVTLTGTLLFPCGLKLSVFDMPEYLVDRKTVISEIVEVSWTESEISIVLDRTDFPTLNEMLAWRAAVLFGADHSKQTNAVRIKDGEEFLVPIPPPPPPPPADPTPDPPPTDPTDPPSPPTPPVDPVDPKDPAEGGLKFPMWLIGVIVGALVAAVAVIVVVFVVRRNSQPEYGVYLYIELDEENAHQPGHFKTATMNRVKQECTLALEALEDDLMDFGGNGMAGKVEAMACSFPHSRVLADESDSIAARLEASGKEGVEKEMGWKQFLKSVLDGLAFLNAENTHSPVFTAINPHMLFIADVGHPADTTQEQEEVRPMRNMHKYQTESAQPGKEVLIGMVGDETDGAETKRTLQHSMRREEVQERFTAPEVKRGEKADVSTALFSLGMVLLELQAEDKELTELVGEMMKAERQARPSLELLRVRVGREGKEGREDEGRVVSVGVDPENGSELAETPLHKTRRGKKERSEKRKKRRMQKVEEEGLENTHPITLTEHPETVLDGNMSVMNLETVEEDAKPKKVRTHTRRHSLKSPKQLEPLSHLALEETATEQPNDGYEEELSMAGSENEEITRPKKKKKRKKGKGKGKEGETSAEANPSD